MANTRREPRGRAKCACTDPKCNVDTLAPKLESFGSYTLNGAIVALSVLKEAAAGTPVPGLRQAAGCGLWVVETIALMGDNKEAFKDLLHRTIDLLLIIIRLGERVHQEKGQVPEEFKSRLGEFENELRKAGIFVEKMNKRGKFNRIIHARADSVKINKCKDDIDHRVSMFQTFMQMDMYLGLNNSKDDKVLDEEKIQIQSRAALQEAAERKVDEYHRALKQNSPTAGPVTINQAPISMVHSPNSRIVNSGNVRCSNYQNSNNDHSVNTYSINGDLWF